MSIENRQQSQNTRAKLEELERLYATTRDRPASSEHVRELTLRSLKKRINQFKEEIARFEAGVGHVARSGAIGPGPGKAE
jgi:uncharacterized small protein (DUF1192 family)